MHPAIVVVLSLLCAVAALSSFEVFMARYKTERDITRRVVYGVLIFSSIIGILGGVFYFGQAVVHLHSLRW